MTDEKEPTFSEDEFGVPRFHGKAIGEKWKYGHHDPFERMLDGELEESLKNAAIRVHDDLDACRDIAVSIFGRHWAAHVIEVFDRVQLAKEPHARTARRMSARPPKT